MALGIFEVHGVSYEGSWNRLPFRAELIASDLGLVQPGDERIVSVKAYQDLVTRARAGMRDIGAESGVTLTDKELRVLIPDATRPNWAINALAADVFYSLGNFIRPGDISWLFNSPFSPRQIIGDAIVGIGNAIEPGVRKGLVLKIRPIMPFYRKRCEELKHR